MTPGLWFRILLLVLLVAVSVAALALRGSHPVPPRELLKSARAAHRAGRFAEAEDLVRRIPDHSQLRPQALLLAAEAAASAGRHAEAAAWYNNLVLDGSSESRQTVITAAERLQAQGQLAAAQDQLRRVIAVDPQNPAALHQLAFLMSVTGRRREASRFLFELLQQGICNMDELILLGHGDLFVDLPAELKPLIEADPPDPDILLWLARRALHEQRPQDAIDLLRRILREHVEHVEAQVRLGAALWEQSALDAFRAWHAVLPEAAEEHPEIWVLRGRQAESENHPEQAARCYWEAIQRDPNHRTAHFRLSHLQSGLNSQETRAFRERAALLSELEKTLLSLYNAGVSGATGHDMQRAAELTEVLGRPWEAWGWCQLALRRDPLAPWAQTTTIRLERLLPGVTVQTVAAGQLATQIDLRRFSLSSEANSSGSAPRVVPIRESWPRPEFVDMARAAGIHFTYFNAGEPHLGTQKMYEGNGGGVGAFDCDGDDWLDLCLAQGCPWPPDPAQQEYTDRLYRNTGDGRFTDVTTVAGTGDRNFSQGVTCGDYDNDGFQDLYVGNIGENRLFHSNGDGTFSDVTATSGTAGDAWTMSSAMADLNEDGLPDLYVVNYLDGSDVFERVCVSDAGISGLCDPRHFAGAQDRLYLNRGDGQFEDVTVDCGIEVEGGKGLGIVVADLNGTGRPSIFVANDGVPNFCFTSRAGSAGSRPLFQESAVLMGLATNGDGQPEACMGVAAADADQDGLLDLFVTNFYHESNILYAQRPGGLFEDATRRAGLRQPSLNVLGFGTQFIDGELDGLPDLLVSNGHVDRGTPGQPWTMQPQYFRNTGHGRFIEIAAESLGAWFEGSYLGRCVTRLDWNRDGRDDVAVAHLDAPLALVTNTTRDAGHFLTVRLRGVRSSRDAVGAVVQLQDDSGTVRTGWLTAGDGYQASNQRQLTFGLWSSQQVVRLTVRWPSGEQQIFEHLPADQSIVLTEGHPVHRRNP